MLTSGFAALTYQIVWTQQLGTWLGHEVAAVLAVIAAFFGGLAFGAWILGGRIARSARPGWWVACLEAAIALWALALVALLPLAGALLVEATGPAPSALRQWTVAFAGPLLLLLPATAAMGATLPAMERVLGQLRERGYAIGGLYALNTAGAMAGTLAAAFWLAPTLGLNGTALLAVLLNIGCALLAWRVLGAVQRDVAPPNTNDAAAQPAAGSRWPVPLLHLALGGLLGIGTEVLVVRALSQLAENTVYTYALLLALYLLGTAVGGAAYQRWGAAHPDTAGLRGRLVAAVALSTLAAAVMLAAAPVLQAAAQAALGNSFGAALGIEAGLGLLAFALPTVAMGALFSHLAVQAREAGATLGEALAANTLGATLAAPLFGVLLLPWVGAGALLAAIAAAYLLLLPAMAWRGAWAWVPAIGAAAMLLAGPALRHAPAPEGGRVLAYADGVLAAVSVTEDAQGVRRLHINNREQEGSSATRLSDARQAWLPLLWHPAPRTALFLGLGTGVTASAAAQDPHLQVQAVELLPEVAAFSTHFADAAAPGADAAQAGRLRVVVTDARRHVRASQTRYDLVVADLFHPARSGSAALFTQEHFQAVRARLATGGLFCQWLPLHQMDLDSLRHVVAAFLQVFPDAVAVLATNSLDTPVLGLLGRDDALRFSPQALQQRLQAVQSLPALDGLQLDDAFAAAGSVLADADALRRFAADAAPHRDDRPLVAYRAPRLRDTPGQGPRERLRQLIDTLGADPAVVFSLQPGSAADADFGRRVAAYWRARQHHLVAGMQVRPVADLNAMLAQVQGPLLHSLQLSPDFRPAYEPLLRMSLALGRSDPERAQALLVRLNAIRPLPVDAAAVLQQLSLRNARPITHSPLSPAPSP